MIRLWIDKTLLTEYIELDQSQVHYIFNVMRYQGGNKILVFNNNDGEWEAELGGLYCDKRIHILRKTRSLEASRVISIAVGCIKKSKLEDLIEKTTELGVDNIFLLNTDYSQRIQYNVQRLRTITIEAAEQSYRLSIPTIHPPQDLSSFLALQLNCVLCHHPRDVPGDVMNHREDPETDLETDLETDGQRQRCSDSGANQTGLQQRIPGDINAMPWGPNDNSLAVDMSTECLTTLGSGCHSCRPSGLESECLAARECAIIGPEGGWSPRELDAMKDLDKIKLNDNILRTETAAVVVMSMMKRCF